MSKTYIKMCHQPLWFPWEKNKRCLFYLVLAAGVIVSKVWIRQICLGKFASLLRCSSRFLSRWWYRNCVFLVHLFSLRETRAILDLCCNCS